MLLWEFENRHSIRGLPGAVVGSLYAPAKIPTEVYFPQHILLCLAVMCSHCTQTAFSQPEGGFAQGPYHSEQRLLT